MSSKKTADLPVPTKQNANMVNKKVDMVSYVKGEHNLWPWAIP